MATCGSFLVFGTDDHLDARRHPLGNVCQLPRLQSQFERREDLRLPHLRWILVPSLANDAHGWIRKVHSFLVRAYASLSRALRRPRLVHDDDPLHHDAHPCATRRGRFARVDRLDVAGHHRFVLAAQVLSLVPRDACCAVSHGDHSRLHSSRQCHHFCVAAGVSLWSGPRVSICFGRTRCRNDHRR